MRPCRLSPEGSKDNNTRSVRSFSSCGSRVTHTAEKVEDFDIQLSESGITSGTIDSFLKHNKVGVQFQNGN